MKELLISAMKSVEEGGCIEAAEEAVTAIKALPETTEGIFDIIHFEDNIYKASGLIYPVWTAYETVYNKKEGYPHILLHIRVLNQKLKTEFTLENVSFFLNMLIQTIMHMSPEIYEYYRELIDIFRDTVKKAVAEFGQDIILTEDNLESKLLFRKAIEKACKEDVLLTEKYIRFFVS